MADFQLLTPFIYVKYVAAGNSPAAFAIYTERMVGRFFAPCVLGL